MVTYQFKSSQAYHNCRLIELLVLSYPSGPSANRNIIMTNTNRSGGGSGSSDNAQATLGAAPTP
jgi:hypothetical protein